MKKLLFLLVLGFAPMASAAPDATVSAPVMPAYASAPVAPEGFTPAKAAAKVEVPTTDSQAASVASQIAAAARSGQWTLLAGLILMLGVYFANRLGLAKFLGKQYIPLVTVGLGVVGNMAYSLVAGEPLVSALINGLFTGASAIAFWETVIKRVTTTKSDGTLRPAKTPKNKPAVLS